ncbi:MAG TPA: hypothetical protein VLD67_22090 [Vicinamibacterales bacterium]|nr:hypothetical protein [Vicinamibacterales bacterium]
MKNPWPLVVVAILAAAPTAADQDPVKVDPAHHAVVLENDQVRVLRITMKPGEKTPSHQHPAGAAVLLTDASIRLTGTGVPADQPPRKAGDVVLAEPTTHVVENTGKTASEVILVELKSSPAGKPVSKSAAGADPKHYHLVAENDRVRVLHVRYGPGEKSVMHDHPALVVVAMSPTQMRMHLPDGKTEDPAPLKRGDVLFMPATRHAPENIGKAAAEAILVELKPR